MRSVVQEWLASREVTLLHPDIWPYTGPTVINCGVAEQALTAVALGLAEHKPVALYGIAGFILLKSADFTPRNMLSSSSTQVLMGATPRSSALGTRSTTTLTSAVSLGSNYTARLVVLHGTRSGSPSSIC